MSRETPRPDAAWDDSRLRELEKLQRLLREVRDINNGNRCLERIALCIQLADELERFDLDTPRPTLMQFFIGQARKDRYATGA